MLRTRSFVVALSACLLGAGCGGDGSSINSNGLTNQTATNSVVKAPDKGDLGVFITDDSSTSYEHLWVLIKKVDLKLAAGGTRTVFDDQQGVGLDLATLKDESGPKYRFINSLAVPAGTYVGAQVTLAKNAMAFPAKSTTAKALPFSKQEGVAQDAVVAVEFDPPKVLGTGHDDLVLSMKISDSKDDQGSLSAEISPSLGAGLEDAARNAPFVTKGSIENLKGDVPTQTFSLKDGKSGGIAISTSTYTALATDLTAAPFVLTKGQTVEVAGSFDTNTRRFEATSIRLLDPKATVASQIAGAVSEIDAKAGTWKITPKMTRGLLPDTLAVSVSPLAESKFFGPSGLLLSKDEFLKALSNGDSINLLVDGSYNTEKSIFDCSEARLQGIESQPAVRVSGIITNPQSDAQAFDVTVSNFQGLMTKPGATVMVAINASTSFTDEAGKSITGEQFFGSMSASKGAEIDGVLDTTTGKVLANTIKLTAAPQTTKKEKKSAKK